MTTRDQNGNAIKKSVKREASGWGANVWFGGGLARAAEIEAEHPATTYKLGRLYGFRPASGTWASTRESTVEAESDIAEDINRRRGYAVKVELFGADGHHCGDNTDSGTMLVTRK